MTDDLVKRLRKFRPTYGWPEEYAITPKQNLNDEAADRIETLEAALREIAAPLKILVHGHEENIALRIIVSSFQKTAITALAGEKKEQEWD